MKKTSKIVVETVRSEPEFDAETIERVQEVETNLSRFVGRDCGSCRLSRRKTPCNCSTSNLWTVPLGNAPFVGVRFVPGGSQYLTIETLESLRREQFPTDTIEIRIPEEPCQNIFFRSL
jgi:hypothetical protein